MNTKEFQAHYNNFMKYYLEKSQDENLKIREVIFSPDFYDAMVKHGIKMENDKFLGCDVSIDLSDDADVWGMYIK